MRTLFQLISFEYRKYVFTRGFLVFLLLFPILGVLGALSMVVNENAAPVRAFVVIDETGGKYQAVIDQALVSNRVAKELTAWDSFAPLALRMNEDDTFPLSAPFKPAPRSDARLSAFANAGGLDAALTAAGPYLKAQAPPTPVVKDSFVRLPLPSQVASVQDADKKLKAIRPFLSGDQALPSGHPLFAVVYIPKDVGDGGTVQFWTHNLIDENLLNAIDFWLTRDVQLTAFEEKGLSKQSVRDIEGLSVPIARYTLGQTGDEGGEAATSDFIRTYLPLGLAYILLVMITTVGSMLLTSTVEEKSNKIIEVLLSSVSATQLMIGKLIGLALVGLTIPSIFLLSAGLAVAFADSNEITAAVQDILLGTNLLPIFIGYFIVGYLLYASIYLAVGAMCNTIQDAQSFVTPLYMAMWLPLPFLQMIVQDPNGIIARIFTWIPIYTPYAIMMRMSSGPPWWEIVGASILLGVTVIYVLGLMGRIYRNGVLSSGGAPTLKQVRELAKRTDT
ncbi:MAG: ABC transporter permease [Pseudomonadota bacterium]